MPTELLEIRAGWANLSIMVAKLKIETDVSELDPAYVAAIEDARAEVDTGKTVPYDAVRRWLLSWGSERELPR
jgi:predicted transcriptional regulator